MPEEIMQYRSAVTDALGRVIPDEGELRVWLDDDLVDRAAPEGWIHLISAREVAFLLLTGRVVELSLDHDLAGAEDDVYDGSDEADAPEARFLRHADHLDHAAIGHGVVGAQLHLGVGVQAGHAAQAHGQVAGGDGFVVEEHLP